MAKTIVCALVGARLDYANSVLVGITTKNVANLQCAQNAVTWVVALGTNHQSTSSSALLKHYHWLPIYQRIQFKIACIIYKTIHITQPAYLNSVLEYYIPSRTLRSSDTNLLSVPRVRAYDSNFCFDIWRVINADYLLTYFRTCFGTRSFSVAALTIWNSLPLDIRNSWSIVSFPRKLKTFIFFNL